MTRKEFEAVQKEHMKLELRLLRLQWQQRMLLERLIGQSVEWPGGYGDFISGTVVSCEDGRYVRVRRSDDVYGCTVGPHLLRLVEKEGQDEPERI